VEIICIVKADRDEYLKYINSFDPEKTQTELTVEQSDKNLKLNKKLMKKHYLKCNIFDKNDSCENNNINKTKNDSDDFTISKNDSDDSTNINKTKNDNDDSTISKNNNNDSTISKNDKINKSESATNKSKQSINKIKKNVNGSDKYKNINIFDELPNEFC
jgi:hypothetical protein